MLNAISPTNYYLATQFAPNPVNAATTQYSFDGFATTIAADQGQLFQCIKSGRFWVYNASSNTFVQVLPYVRTDDGLTAVQMTNNSGNLKLSRPAGATAGSFNGFDRLTVNPDGVYLPQYISPSSTSTYINGNTGRLETSVNYRQPLSSDFPITSTASPTVISALTFSNSTDESACYEYNFQLQFYHNNQYEMNAAVRQHRSNTYYSYINTGTVSSQTGGYTQLSLRGWTDQMIANEQLRLYVWPSVSGVEVRRYGPRTWTSTDPPAAPPVTFEYATFSTVRRLS